MYLLIGSFVILFVLVGVVCSFTMMDLFLREVVLQLGVEVSKEKEVLALEMVTLGLELSNWGAGVKMGPRDGDAIWG